MVAGGTILVSSLFALNSHAPFGREGSLLGGLCMGRAGGWHIVNASCHVLPQSEALIIPHAYS